MTEQRKVIAITGSQGYIGNVLKHWLVSQGYDVIGCDIKKDVIYGAQNNILEIQSGFEQPAFLFKIFQANENNRLAGIVHLAADSLLGPSVYDPLPYYTNNVGNSVKLIQFLIENNIHVPFIFASSAAVYGNIPGERIDYYIETDPKRPINPYGRTKAMFEDILEDAFHAYGFGSTALRFFNVCGGYGIHGQPKDQPHIITSLCRAAKDTKSFTVNGMGYVTRDGTCVRDYVHVLDVCEVIKLRLESDGSGFNVYNVGGDHEVHRNGTHGFSNMNLIDKFVEITETEFHIDFGPKRPGDPDHLVASTEKLWDDYRWTTKHSSLENIIKTAWAAYNA